MISVEGENIVLWAFVASCIAIVFIYAFSNYKDTKRFKKLDEQRYKEHKEIIDLIYFVKNELLTRHID